jgi:hypothetical protein
MYPLGADLPSSCDSQTQYFDSEFTQTCRSFSDVGPPAAPVKLGPSCAAYAKHMNRPPEAYASRSEADCAKKLAVSIGGGKKAPSSHWLLPVVIGGGIIALVMLVRH